MSKTPPPWMGKTKSSSAIVISEALDGVETRKAGAQTELCGFEGIIYIGN